MMALVWPTGQGHVVVNKVAWLRWFLLWVLYSLWSLKITVAFLVDQLCSYVFWSDGCGRCFSTFALEEGMCTPVAVYVLSVARASGFLGRNSGCVASRCVLGSVFFVETGFI
jgi:hypothetical protein